MLRLGPPQIPGQCNLHHRQQKLLRRVLPLLLTSPGVIQLASAGLVQFSSEMMVRGVTIRCEATVCVQNHKPAIVRRLCAGGSAACSRHG